MRIVSKKSFTMLEILLAIAIISFAICGILAMYVNSFDLISTSKNISIATAAAQRYIEEIRNSTFDDIVNTYDATVWSVPNMPENQLFIYVNDTNPDSANRLRVTISVCWRQKNRVIGEDKNLNGVLNAGEDISPANGIIDSPVQLVTLVVNR